MDRVNKLNVQLTYLDIYHSFHLTLNKDHRFSPLSRLVDTIENVLHAAINGFFLVSLSFVVRVLSESRKSTPIMTALYMRYFVYLYHVFSFAAILNFFISPI